MDFSQALQAVKKGMNIAREGWNGKNMWVGMALPGRESLTTHPFLYIEYPEEHHAYPNGCRVPWLASQTDMLAEDWMIVGGSSKA